MKYLARVECSDHIAIVSGDDKGQVKRMAVEIRINDIKRQIADAVWNRQIDQMNTREVAEQFIRFPATKSDVAKTCRILLKIANGTSKDERFIGNPDRAGVIINDGSTWTYSPTDINGETMSCNGSPMHYIWFCS